MRNHDPTSRRTRIAYANLRSFTGAGAQITD
jgi:hypothetical protein